MCTYPHGCDVLDSEEMRLLHQVMAEESAARTGRRLDMMHVWSKLCMHKWMGRMPPEALDFLLVLIAGRGAFVIIYVDSAHYRFNRYCMVDGARWSLIYQKATIKQHAWLSLKYRKLWQLMDVPPIHLRWPSCAPKPRTGQDMTVGGLRITPEKTARYMLKLEECHVASQEELHGSRYGRV